MKPILPLLVVGLAAAACSQSGEGDAVTEPETAAGEEPAAQATADGNEFNPQAGEDAGLPLDIRIFPGGAIVERAEEDGTQRLVFTSPEASMQVIDWYFRKLDARGFDFRMQNGGMAGFTATSAEGSVTLETGEGGRYTLSVTPAS